MNTRTALHASVLIAMLSAAALAVAHEEKSMPGKAMGHDPAAMELRKAMMIPGDMKMPMTGDVDRDFAAMMVMHHQQAIRMADIELRSGHSAALKAMAQKMKDAQQKEITELSKYR